MHQNKTVWTSHGKSHFTALVTAVHADEDAPIMQSCLPRSINAAKKTSQKNGSSTIYTALPAETCNTCYVIAMCLFYLYLPLKSSEQKMFNATNMNDYIYSMCW